MDVSREQHQNMYIIYSETDHQPRLDARDNRSDLVHWEDLEGWGGEGSGGGGIGMGHTCTPMADSCQCMAKPLQCCKAISLQPIKTNGTWPCVCCVLPSVRWHCVWEENAHGLVKNAKTATTGTSDISDHRPR